MLLGSVIVANMMQSIAAIPITLRRLRLEKMILYQFGDTLDTDELIALTKEGDNPNVCTKAEFVLGGAILLIKKIFCGA